MSHHNFYRNDSFAITIILRRGECYKVMICILLLREINIMYSLFAEFWYSAIVRHPVVVSDYSPACVWCCCDALSRGRPIVLLCDSLMVRDGHIHRVHVVILLLTTEEAGHE